MIREKKRKGIKNAEVSLIETIAPLCVRFWAFPIENRDVFTFFFIHITTLVSQYRIHYSILHSFSMKITFIWRLFSFIIIIIICTLSPKGFHKFKCEYKKQRGILHSHLLNISEMLTDLLLNLKKCECFHWFSVFYKIFSTAGQLESNNN